MRPDPPRGFGDHTTAAEKNAAGNTVVCSRKDTMMHVFNSFIFLRILLHECVMFDF